MARKIDLTTRTIRESIDNQIDFVLQGGAGSGKTETLKQTVEYILDENPDTKLLCITHTNLAVDEIRSRISGTYTASTIHSFLNELIKNFKVNIKTEMIDLFLIEKINFPKEEDSTYEGNEYKQKRHAKYKKIYAKCEKISFRLLNETFDKVPDKKTFDQEYKYDDKGKIINNHLEKELNDKIQQVNEKTKKDINDIPHYSVHYNNSKFNNRENLGYGHDGLIQLAVKLIKKHSILQKILQDNYDYILIDEYQDADPGVISAIIDCFSSDLNTIGLFGDSMQTIYDEGIGSVQTYINDGKLKEIMKEDNYRSSYPIVDFINNIRTDSLKQEVAFKKKKTGKLETKVDRQGKVTFYYVFSEDGHNSVEEFVKQFLKDKEEYDALMLTNRLIATELEFKTLYNIFSARGPEPIERMEKDLSVLLVKELYEVINAYNNENYNLIIQKLNYNGWSLRKMQDKIEIANVLSELNSGNRNIEETLEFAFRKKILSKTEQYENYIIRRDNFLKELDYDKSFIKFEKLYKEGGNTYSRINKKTSEIYSKSEFKNFENSYNRKIFYNDLFSNKVKFKEIINYYDYMINDGKRKTMHKTKGTGIQNVAVILDNFGWYKYNFTKMFNDDPTNSDANSSLNLFYVACSRAIENLIILKFVKSEEEIDIIKDKFENNEKQICFEEIKLSDIYK